MARPKRPVVGKTKDGKEVKFGDAVYGIVHTYDVVHDDSDWNMEEGRAIWDGQVLLKDGSICSPLSSWFYSEKKCIEDRKKRWGW